MDSNERHEVAFIMVTPKRTKLTLSRKNIIPALDLSNKTVVRLYKGDFSKKESFSASPLHLATTLLKTGVRWLHVIDLDAARLGSLLTSPNHSIISELLTTCHEWHVKIQLGGGIRSMAVAHQLLREGFDRIILGTLALEQPEALARLIKKFPSRIVVALDCRDNIVMTRGWTRTTKLRVHDALRFYEDLGVDAFLITDIQRDGTLQGMNVKLYQSLHEMKRERTRIIASGGARSITDINEVLAWADAVIVGKAILDGTISTEQVKQSVIQHHVTDKIKRIIPCLDVKDGRVVKGIKFKNLKDAGDPVELARLYDREGADELVFLDITATLEGRKAMLDVIRAVAEEVYIPFSVGGGIRTLDDMTAIIRAGAEKVSINSAAVKNPKLITQGAKKFGSQCIMVAIDAKRSSAGWEVYVNAGTTPTGLDAISWAEEAVTRGAGELLVTSIDRDGTKSGYDLELLAALRERVNVPLIISGGAGSMEHFKDALTQGADAALAASLFHQKELRIQQLKHYLNQHDIPVRDT